VPPNAHPSPSWQSSPCQLVAILNYVININTTQKISLRTGFPQELKQTIEIVVELENHHQRDACFEFAFKCVQRNYLPWKSRA